MAAIACLSDAIENAVNFEPGMVTLRDLIKQRESDGRPKPKSTLMDLYYRNAALFEHRPEQVSDFGSPTHRLKAELSQMEEAVGALKKDKSAATDGSPV